MDISQYVEEPIARLRIKDIYQTIPGELVQKNKRFTISKLIDKSAYRNNNFVDDHLWLTTAGLAIPVYGVDEPTNGLRIGLNRKTVKLFLNDVGLLSSDVLSPELKTKVLAGKEVVNYGSPYENAAAELLVAHGFDDKLYYWNSKKHGEIDFLVEINGMATPIEIKSGKPTDMLYYNHSALKNVIKTYGYERAYVFGETNLIKESNAITKMSIYLLDFLRPND